MVLLRIYKEVLNANLTDNLKLDKYVAKHQKQVFGVEYFDSRNTTTHRTR